MSVHHSFELVSGMSLGPKASFDHLRFARNGSLQTKRRWRWEIRGTKGQGRWDPVANDPWRKLKKNHFGAFLQCEAPKISKLVNKSPVTKVISTINHSEMGVMCTNLDIDRGPHIVPPQNKQPSNCLAICGTHHTGDLRSILCFSLLEGAPRGWRSMAAVHCRMGLHDVTWWSRNGRID